MAHTDISADPGLSAIRLQAAPARPSRAVRRAEGKAVRGKVPRTSHAAWRPADDRPDPVAQLEASNATRVPELAPIRFGRMLVSPFTYLRGSPGVMAGDFATTPTTGFEVQACGDAHLLNFGLFASPERHLLFDVNDFDETVPGPWEWDVKRLTTSLVVAARDRGFTEAQCEEAALVAAFSYRTRIREYSLMGNLDVWYSQVDADVVLAQLDLDETRRALVQKTIDKARRHTSLAALPKLTQVVDGRRRIIDNPPLIEHVDSGIVGEIEHDIEAAKAMFQHYVSTLSQDRRALLERYRFVDLARKVVGVGSVGTRCAIVLMVGSDGHDPLFLQIKEAEASVLEPHWRRSRLRNHGERVVIGQRLMQAASDIFLGWTADKEGHHFYFRQLRDMKGSVDVSIMMPEGLAAYGGLCGWALARAHARSGDAARLTGYMGTGSCFEETMARFATAYADQNERDYETLQEAVKSGRVAAEMGL